MIKFTILLRRKPTLTHDQFVTHHKQVHAPLFASLPAVQEHVRRYLQQHTIPVDLPGMPPVTFDGITELWFDDTAGLAAVFGDAEYLARIRPDEESFLDLHGCEFIVSAENPVIG